MVQCTIDCIPGRGDPEFNVTLNSDNLLGNINEIAFPSECNLVDDKIECAHEPDQNSIICYIDCDREASGETDKNCTLTMFDSESIRDFFENIRETCRARGRSGSVMCTSVD